MILYGYDEHLNWLQHLKVCCRFRCYICFYFDYLLLYYCLIFYIMPTKCIVCGSLRNKSSKFSFHRFPKPKEVRKRWLQVCQIDEQHIKPDTIVCSKHFKVEDFDDSAWPMRKLLAGAVPAPSIHWLVQKKHQVLQSNIKQVSQEEMEVPQFSIKQEIPDLTNEPTRDYGTKILDLMAIKVEPVKIESMEPVKIEPVEPVKNEPVEPVKIESVKPVKIESCTNEFGPYNLDQELKWSEEVKIIKDDDAKYLFNCS